MSIITLIRRVMLSVMSLFFEAKKTIFKPHIYVVITLFLIINHLSCLQYIEHRNAEFSPEYQQAEIEIHEKIDGNITQEKVSWIINEKQRLNSIISSGQFSTDYEQAGTYTGYVYSDNNLINKIYDELKYNVEYHLFAQEVVDGARKNIELYKSKNNHTKVAFYQYMADAFSSRSLNTFYRTDGWNEYYTYSFSNLLIVLSMLLGLTSTFSIETDLKIRPVLQITPKSMRTINFQKVLLSMLISSLFNDWGYTKIILDTNLNNKRAQHVYEELGFKKVRVNIDCWRNQIGELQSSIDYELCQEDFVNFAQ